METSGTGVTPCHTFGPLDGGNQRGKYEETTEWASKMQSMPMSIYSPYKGIINTLKRKTAAGRRGVEVGGGGWERGGSRPPQLENNRAPVLAYLDSMDT